MISTIETHVYVEDTTNPLKDILSFETLISCMYSNESAFGYELYNNSSKLFS